MATKEELQIIISAKDQTKGIIGGLSGSLGKLGKLAGTAVVAGIGATTAAVGGLAVGLGVLAKDAAQLGPIEEAFEGIAESSGKSADELMDAFRRQSGGLIRNTDLMKSYNMAASLVSDDFANELPNAMNYLSRVSAATGEDMGFLMDSLVRGVGRVSPMILDNLGVQVDLTAATEAYAESVGKTAKELTKSEQQMAIFDAVMQQLAINTENLPEMSDPFKQLSVTLVILKDTAAKEIGGAFLPLIQDLADEITEFVSSEEFQQWIRDVARWLREELIPWLKDAYRWVKEELLPALREFWEWLSPKIEAMKAGIAGLRSAWESDFIGIKTFVEGVWEGLQLTFELFSAAFEGDWEKFGDTLQELWKSIWDTIKGVMEKRIEDTLEYIRSVDWGQVGRDILTAIGNGVLSVGRWWAMLWFKMGQTAINAVLGAFNITLPNLGGGGENPTTSSNMNTWVPGHSRIKPGQTTVNLTYSPAVSFVDQYEVERQLVPIINDALRR